VGFLQNVIRNVVVTALGAKLARGRSPIVGALARETGLPRDDLLSQLSLLLPEVIDKLSPKGRLPRDEDLLPGPDHRGEQRDRRSA
jgi:uncharacterized protein YidB (DUF937 family)